MSITSAGSSTSLAQLRQLQQAAFKTADVDGDGQLSLSEFQSVGQNVQGQGEQRGPPPMRGGGGPNAHFSEDTLSALLSTQSVDDVASSVMEAGDSDGDGKLTSSELSTALSAKATDETEGQDELVSKIVEALDSDGDGSLSSSEISTAISDAASRRSETQGTRGPHAPHGPPPGPPPSEEAEGSSGACGASSSSGVFESLDTNQDGVVSAEELAAANSGESTDATSTASHLIGAADQDGHGSLSGEEFYALLDQGKATSADSTDSLSSLLSSSTNAADLVQKLLAQLDTALTSSSSSKTSSGTSVTA